MTAVIEFFDEAVWPLRAFEKEAAAISFGASVGGDGCVQFLASEVVVGDLGGGDAEEDEVIHPFGDGADSFGSKDVGAGVCEIAVNAR